ncbi:MAG: DUF362 domain-containing protein [Deltaproteobacteria bacterium]|nr:DUF362 domain-containing protein [Deltaproteobacteria bacterium]
MTSAVHFCDLKASFERPLKKRFRQMLQAAGLEKAVPDKGLVAVKLHFGEAGNTAFIRPTFVRWVVEAIKEAGGRPFVTDSNTLYVGSRSDSASHLVTALANGFGYESIGAPLIIADGLKGGSETALPVEGRRVKEAFFGADIVAADGLISLAHFKGHELAGFGGAIKNIGMGSASRRGKLAQHSTLAPKINEDKCLGCGTCLEFCPAGALDLADEVALLDQDKCLGCGTCILVCPEEAVEIQWNREPSAFMEAMAEYASALAKKMAGRLLNVNFLTQITPDCDCLPFSSAPLVPDIGFLASPDPVAIDQASWDLVTSQISLNPKAKDKQDKFKAVYPKVDPAVQLDHGQRLGLGTRQYKLKKIR